MTVYGGKYMGGKKRAASNGPGMPSFGPALSLAEEAAHEKGESARDRAREYGPAKKRNKNVVS